MPYSSSLTDEEWEIIEPLLPADIADEETDQTFKLDKKRTLGWHLLSTQEWLQLARLTQRPATVLDRLLALAFSGAQKGQLKH